MDIRDKVGLIFIGIWGFMGISAFVLVVWVILLAVQLGQEAYFDDNECECNPHTGYEMEGRP
jgi:hypothetical protein